MRYLRGPALPHRALLPVCRVAEPVSPLSRTRGPGVPPPVPSSYECEAGTKRHPQGRSKSSPSSSPSLPSPATTSRGANETGGEALLLILADLACGGGTGEVPFARQCCEELEMPKNHGNISRFKSYSFVAIGACLCRAASTAPGLSFLRQAVG
jgi:hypothetical protein